VTTTVESTAETTVEGWPPLREMDPAVSQRAFHVLMEAFSRPGTLHSLPVESFPAAVPAAVVPLLALADLMTPITGLDAEGRAAVAAIARLTGAPVASPEGARFALALAEPQDFAHLNTGSHWSPETGAMLVQRVAALEVLETPTPNPNPTPHRSPGTWRVSGPGVPPDQDRCVRVAGLSAAWPATRQALVAGYPTGVDCLLITDEGTLVALSRTTVIEVV
jgi:alpha-D-ribose 1-methylphosphonate 5-triphosphate synthase subunit PhnH